MSRRLAAGLARRGSEAPVRQLHLRVAPPRDALDRFEAAWNRVAEGERMTPLRVLTLRDLPLLLRTLTPARCRSAIVVRSASDRYRGWRALGSVSLTGG